ncbi:esterase/lipase family protein [Providencia rettgeri]|uniref:esterase/lipase family protein n=1 Tax=Providencia rettgeri TaxID=587 RepID=UPI0034E089F1
MSEKDTPEAGECLHVSYHLPQWDEKGKCSWVDIQLQHKSLNAEAKCIVPPTKVIPIIFIPGIMGTNLKSDVGESSWNAEWFMGADSLKFVPKDGAERRRTLDPDTTTVENRYKSTSYITHSVFSDDGNLFPTRYKRQWGQALSLSYGEFLEVFQYALLDDWQTDIYNFVPEVKATSTKIKGVLNDLVGDKLGDTHDSPLTAPELTHFKRFLFPVHVFGYNWLKDNAISAEELTLYIDNVLDMYKYDHGYGLAIEKVILVTHSMGGLVARYAMNPPKEVTFNGCQDKVLGVVHGVIPDLGSPAAYRRMKTGAGKEGTPGKVLGATAEKLMPVLARAPAALQLLPYPSYKSPWLTIEGEGSYPKTKDPKTGKLDPFTDIYLRNDVWWKLYQSNIIDSEQVKIDSNWKSYARFININVRNFMEHQEQGLYHPNTYVFYGTEEKTDGFLAWNTLNDNRQTVTLYYAGKEYTRKVPYVDPNREMPHNQKKVLLSDGQYCDFILTQSDTAGDGTVPIESLEFIKRNPLIKSVLATNVDHQNAYALNSVRYSEFSDAIKFTLRSIIKIVQEVDARAAD